MGHKCWAKPGSPNYRPAKGFVYNPPSGMPARGAGGGAEAWPLYDGQTQPSGEHKKIGRMEAKEYRDRLRAKLARAEAVYDEAFDGDNLALKLTATKQLEDRVLGQAKQVVETTEVPKTREELLAEVEAAKRDAGLI